MRNRPDNDLFGWNGKDEPGSAKRLLAAFVELKHNGIDKDLLIDLNDSGTTFDETGDYLDRTNELTNLK